MSAISSWISSPKNYTRWLFSDRNSSGISLIYTFCFQLFQLRYYHNLQLLYPYLNFKRSRPNWWRHKLGHAFTLCASFKFKFDDKNSRVSMQFNDNSAVATFGATLYCGLLRCNAWHRRVQRVSKRYSSRCHGSCWRWKSIDRINRWLTTWQVGRWRHY